MNLRMWEATVRRKIRRGDLKNELRYLLIIIRVLLNG